MTAAPGPGRPGGGQVLALVPPAPAGAAAPAAPLAGVLDAYARQPDEIATLVEDWRATLPDTASTRRYTRAVLAALGELHVALDTAAHLAQHRTQPATAAAAVVPQRPLCPSCVTAEARPCLWRRLAAWTSRIRRTP